MADDIRTWLVGLGFGMYVDAFVENAVDRDLLPHLSNDDLKDLGITKLGDRKKLLLAIEQLEANRLKGPDEAGIFGATPAVRGRAERRQLTLMFCDLVGSTGLSARLDPEDLRDVLRHFQNAVAGEVARYEGHIAKFMGDGVLIYFGYPRAQEDAAERAVRAGLAIVDTTAALETGFESLSVRIGVATGHVVVGDLLGEGAAQEEAVTGQTPNLAARLQQLAEPGSIVVAESTHDLLGELFGFEHLGEHILKGLTDPVSAWRVTGEIAADSRFEAIHTGRLTRFVGREQELELLKERWARAKEGEGQVVLLTGEAGIGKSRLTRALIDHLADIARTLSYQCSPHHANSALHPFVGQLERAATFEVGDDDDTQLAKLEAVLRQGFAETGEVVPVFAALLSVPTGDTYSRPELEPKRQKKLTFNALLAQLSGLATRRPVLMIFEDAHWADPTTLELLAEVVDRIQDWAILAVITGRPEFQPGWPGHSHVTKLTLNRLGHRHGTEIVSDLTGGKRLPRAVLDQIVAKTDGVPLFVEELTKAVLESDLLRELGDRYELIGPLPLVAIPSTLQDSLLARLDRLSPVKEVAQIGAVIGREFTYELLAAVAPLPEHQLRKALDQLVAAELVFRRGTPPDATYIFKHALVQEVAYDTLLRTRRQELHMCVAMFVRDRLPNTVTTEPEVLARHLTEAGRAGEAIPFWHKAGLRASERSGYVEAVAHLTRGLEVLTTLPETLERDRQELQLQITLGPALMAIGSYSNPEMERTYLRARELAHRVNDPDMLFAATWGIWHNQTFLRVGTGRRLTEELLALARRQSTDQGYLLQAHHAAWTTLLCVPELAACLEHAEQGIALYDIETHRAHKLVYGGHDPGACALIHRAMVLWLLGYPDQAAAVAHEAVALSRRFEHAVSQAQILAHVCFVHQFCRESESAKQRAAETINLCVEQDIGPQYAAFAKIVLGWAESADGRTEQGLTAVREGLDRLKAIGQQLRRSYLLSLYAEVCARAGHIDEGLAALDEALSSAERWWMAEFHRLRGEMLLSRSAKNLDEAEACYRTALDLARRQQANSLELRAAVSLARVWGEQGKRNDARDVLAPVCARFTEGFDTADLKDAMTLLDELS